ncbi:MAG: hypothetical protein U5J64_00370 [Halobacteriales archaeon]|nr:hypothetical protein [Halobacteriales archaeon]
MATETGTEKGHPSAGVVSNALRGWNLDALVAALSLLMMFGIALDFRSHAAGISFEEEGFFTPEHVFFYTAFLCIAGVIGTAVFVNKRKTGSWRTAVPQGYALGLAGVAIFGFGGFGDYLWHSAFGFEEGIEGLTSPTHLMLATGAVLFFSSPLRSALRRSERPSGFGFVPVLIPMSLVLTIIALFTLYVNPVIDSTANVGTGQGDALGVVSLFFFPALLVGGALVLVSRFDLPMGALAFTFAVPALLSAPISGHYFLALPAIAAGLVGDIVNGYYLSRSESVLPLRLFGTVVPATFVVGYLAVVEVVWGITWTIHIWAGTVFLAGAGGLLLTYVVVSDGSTKASRFGSET